MSGLNKLRQKAAEGKNWRGSIRVPIDDEEVELTVRQLTDPELFEVMSLIDQDELEGLRGDLPDDELERYYDLQEKEELTEEEEEEFVDLEELLNEQSANLFQELSRDTFNGITLCAKYTVEPDDDDLRTHLMDSEWTQEKEDAGYGPLKEPADCYDALKDDIEDSIDSMTNFTSFNIGMMALMETLGDIKN